jgi:hypothetical protein
MGRSSCGGRDPWFIHWRWNKGLFAHQESLRSAGVRNRSQEQAFPLGQECSLGSDSTSQDRLRGIFKGRVNKPGLVAERNELVGEMLEDAFGHLGRC